jgi:hypothetical protein
MITFRPLLTRTTTTLLLLLAACTDDDSSATTSASSTSTGTADLSSEASTAADPTAADTSTGAPATDGSSTGTGTVDTGTADTGTAATDDSTGAEGLEIAGEWFEEFSPGEGITHSIDETRWEQVAAFGTAIFHVDGYDNEARVVVARADAANEFNPDLYSRFDWTWDGEDLYYCAAVFDAATPEDALMAPASDPGDLEMGCAGFPWSALVPSR